MILLSPLTWAFAATWTRRRTGEASWLKMPIVFEPVALTRTSVSRAETSSFLMPTASGPWTTTSTCRRIGCGAMADASLRMPMAVPLVEVAMTFTRVMRGAAPKL